MRKVALGTRKKRQRKHRPTYAAVGGDCEAVHFLLSNFSIRHIGERHLLEANLPSSIWMGEGSCMLRFQFMMPDDVNGHFRVSFTPAEIVPSISFQSIVLNSFKLFLCNLARG